MIFTVDEGVTASFGHLFHQPQRKIVVCERFIKWIFHWSAIIEQELEFTGFFRELQTKFNIGFASLSGQQHLEQDLLYRQQESVNGFLFHGVLSAEHFDPGV